MSTWRQLDAQMARFSDRLINAVKLSPEIAERLASSVAADVRFLSQEEKLAIKSFRQSRLPIGFPSLKRSRGGWIWRGVLKQIRL